MKKLKEPCLYRLPDGRYHVLVSKRDKRTRRQIFRKETLAAGATIDDARVVRTQLQLALQEEVRDAVPLTGADRGRRITVADYAAQWMRDYAASAARRSTIELTEQTLADHILPELGHLELRHVNRAVVQRWVSVVDRKRKPDGSPYGIETKKSWWRKLQLLLRHAVADGFIERDPLDCVQPPRVGADLSREQETLSATQLERFLESVAETSPHRYAEVLTFATTGARSGEVYALTWRDITVERQPKDGRAVEVPIFDPEWSEFELRRHRQMGELVNGQLRIERAHYRGTVDGPKTRKGHRALPLQVAVLSAIEAHALQMREDEHPGLASGLVFPSKVGTHRIGNSVYGPMRVAARRAGIDVHVTPLVLRRTLNTLLVEKGIAEALTRSIMGHVTKRMTRNYLGSHIEAKRQVIESAIAVPVIDRAD